MDQELKQRRRVAFAAAITVLAIPGYFLIGAANRGAGADTVPTSIPATTTPHDAGPLGTIPLGYLAGKPDDDQGAVPTIATGERREILITEAIFLYGFKTRSVCLVPGAPRDETVTIVNTDNGRGVQCRNSADPDKYAKRSDAENAMLNIDDFLKLGDLTDAPLPVEVTW